VIGIIPMPGAHNAKTIKLCVEHMVNEFDFDKSKINGKLSLKNSNY
jgi:hypothetical protein